MIDYEKLNEMKQGVDDDYVLAIFRIAEKVMEYLEADIEQNIDAEALIRKADKELGEGITGYQNGIAISCDCGMVAYVVLSCHSRGREFAKSWNEGWGVYGVDDKVINPAILEI